MIGDDAALVPAHVGHGPFQPGQRLAIGRPRGVGGEVGLNGHMARPLLALGVGNADSAGLAIIGDIGDLPAIGRKRGSRHAAFAGDDAPGHPAARQRHQPERAICANKGQRVIAHRIEATGIGRGGRWRGVGGQAQDRPAIQRQPQHSASAIVRFQHKDCRAIGGPARLAQRAQAGDHAGGEGRVIEARSGVG